jgi:spore coat protein U-like protein
MTSGAATITGTGIGAADTLSTSIVGTIASGQSGKAAGSYSKTMTLNLVY